MADLVSAFDSKDHNFTNVSRNNIIDHFFTQRKVIDYQEYIDTNMNMIFYKFMFSDFGRYCR